MCIYHKIKYIHGRRKLRGIIEHSVQYPLHNHGIPVLVYCTIGISLPWYYSVVPDIQYPISVVAIVAYIWDANGVGYEVINALRVSVLVAETMWAICSMKSNIYTNVYWTKTARLFFAIWHIDCLPKPLVDVHIKENIKAWRYWSLWGKSTGHQWIPFTKGQ